MQYNLGYLSLATPYIAPDTILGPALRYLARYEVDLEQVEWFMQATATRSAPIPANVWSWNDYYMHEMELL